MVKVSVIVPVYNGQPYIRECIDSLLSQNLKEIEIIIIDDGSNDGTEELVDDYGRDYEHIKVVHQHNHGLYYTRKYGISLASGEYVGFVDADDFVMPEMYETLYNEAVKNDSDLVFCDYEFYPARIKNKAKWYRAYRGQVDVEFTERNSQPWNKIVRRSLLLDLGIADMFESCFDEAYIKVLINAKNPISIDKKMYNYRMGNNTMSTSYTDIAHYERFVGANKCLRDAMQCDDEYWNEYFDYRVDYYILMTMLVAAYAGNKEKFNNWRMRLKTDRQDYKKNRHFMPILIQNNGKLKAYIISTLDRSYLRTRLISQVVFFGK